MDLSARLGCTFAYGRAIDAAYSDDLLTDEQRREARDRAERVVAKVDRWLAAGDDGRPRRELLSVAEVIAAGGEVIGASP